MVNSRAKGARGERELSSKLKEYGYETRRGQNGQFLGEENIYIVQTNETFCDIYLGENKIAIIDNKDFLRMKRFHWYKSSNGYIYDSKTMIMLHRYVMRATGNEVIDHINRDKTDNRKSNLRKCTKSENAYNSKVKINNTSKVTGVWFRKDTNKWVAEIKHEYKKISLGCFADKDDAIKARKEAERIYCNDFIPMEGYND